MGVHTISKGLDLPIRGAPAQRIELGHSKAVSTFAVLAADFVGSKARMVCKIGDEVSRGTPLFEDRKTPGVFHTAPVAGRVTAINRGEFRALQSVVIEAHPDEAVAGWTPTAAHQVTLARYAAGDPSALERAQVVDLLVESGLWTYLRTRPFGRVADPSGPPPFALYINAADTHPLAPSPEAALAHWGEDFAAGLAVLAKLPSEKTYLCRMKGSKVGPGSLPPRVQLEEFDGPHPAGTVGFHIHTLSPVSRARTVWHLDYQQVRSIGALFRTGLIDERRVVSLAGPGVANPRLLEVRRGACLDEIVAGELCDGEQRVVSGSVLGGRTAMGAVDGYLGAHHRQISVLREGRDRHLLGWLTPGLDKFSVTGIYVSAFMPRKLVDFDTNTNGGHRAMVPIGTYERVFPFDILPTFLLRALAVDDVERAEALGALELDEEDMALCTFVCPGKLDHAHELRRNLDLIWKEG